MEILWWGRSRGTSGDTNNNLWASTCKICAFPLTSGTSTNPVLSILFKVRLPFLAVPPYFNLPYLCHPWCIFIYHPNPQRLASLSVLACHNFCPYEFLHIKEHPCLIHSSHTEDTLSDYSKEILRRESYMILFHTSSYTILLSVGLLYSNHFLWCSHMIIIQLFWSRFHIHITYYEINR